MERLEIVQFLHNATEISTKEVAIVDNAVFIGQIFHQLVPILVDKTVACHTVWVGDGGAVETVGENLIGHTAPKPVWCLMGGVVDGLLPIDRFPLATVAVFAQIDRTAVRTVKAEAVPNQLWFGRDGVADRKTALFAIGFPLCFREGNFAVFIGKFAVDQQRTALESLRGKGAERERDVRTARYGTEWLFIPTVTRIKYRKIHIQKYSLSIKATAYPQG